MIKSKRQRDLATYPYLFLSLLLLIGIWALPGATHASNTVPSYTTHYLDNNDLFRDFENRVYMTKGQIPLEELIDEHLVEYLEIIDDLEVRFPSSEFHLVIMGRSLTMLAGILESQKIRPFTALPLSGLNEYMFGYASKQGSFIHKTVYEKIENFYFPHFKKHLPENIGHRKDNKKIVLVDFVASGASLHLGQALLTQYYQHLGLPGIVYSVGVKYRNEKVSDYGSWKVDHPSQFIDVSHALAASLADNQAKEYSHVPQFYPFVEPIPPANPLQYKRLVEAINKKMAVLVSRNKIYGDKYIKCQRLFQISFWNR